jgi:hypothetical protein
MGEKKNSYIVLFMDLRVQEGVCISRKQDEDAKDRSQSQKTECQNRWLNTLGTERGGSQVRTAHCTAGRNLGQQIQHGYHLCREQILRTLLW